MSERPIPNKWTMASSKASTAPQSQGNEGRQGSSTDIQSTFSEAVNHGSQLGQNYGTISSYFGLPPEKSEGLRLPTHTLPFCRDSDFVNRGALLDQIETKCSSAAARTALVGLGGIGKSQLAIEYAYRLREREPQTWVFWVHAGTATRFEEGYRAIAEAAKLPHRNDPNADILQQVKSWLSDWRNGKWLMILDNADDVSMFFSKVTRSPIGGISNGTSMLLSRYLPVSENGSILITTRDEDAGFRLTGYERNIIVIRPMEENHALSLLKRKLGDDIGEDAALELVRTLDCIALAITQAAVSIRQKKPRMSIRQYVRYFRGCHRDKAGLLTPDLGDLRRDPSASNSVITTLQISFDRIKQNHSSAADLLSLMSLFDRQGIPDSLLNRTCDDEANGQSYYLNDKGTASGISEFKFDSQWEEDIAVLRKFSLISISADGSLFEMHRLVQLAAKAWVETSGNLETYKQIYIERLNADFPSVVFDHLKKCQLLFAHAEAAMDQTPTDEKVLLVWARLLHKAAAYAFQNGTYNAAEKLLCKIIREAEAILGNDAPIVLESVDLLGHVFSRKGKYYEAENLHERARVGFHSAYGPEDFKTLDSVNSIVITKISRGLPKEAETLQLGMLRIQKDMHGAEHHITLRAMTGLAQNYIYQRRLEEAEKLATQVLQTRIRTCGSDHPYTLTISSVLADMYFRQKRYTEAEKLGIHVREARRRVLGPEHPDTLFDSSILADIYFHQERLEEAEGLQAEVIERGSRMMGSQNPFTLYGMARLAETWKAQGHLDKAIELMSEVVERQTQILGSNHSSTKSSAEYLKSWREELEIFTSAHIKTVVREDTSKGKERMDN